MSVDKMSVLGDRAYRFSWNGGRKSTDACMIIAHGSTAEKPFRIPPEVTIHFYTDRGGSILSKEYPLIRNVSSSLAMIGDGSAKPSETINGGDICPDYDLSKFLKSTTGLTNGNFTNRVEHRSSLSYDDVEFHFKKNRRTMDTISIRHRFFRKDLTLSEIVRELGTNTGAYTEFHCNFCRDIPNTSSGSSDKIRTFDLGEKGAMQSLIPHRG